MNIKNLSESSRKNLSFVIVILSILCMSIGSMIYGNRNVNASSYDDSTENVSSYTLRVDPNGGTLPNTIFGDKNGTSETALLTVYYGKGDCNQIGVPTWTNHHFVGYYDSYIDGKRVFDYKGEAVNGTYWDGWYGNAKWKYSGDLTVYARWEEEVYTVNFNKNGGSGSISSRAYTVGVYYNLPSTGYTRNNYTLIGWCKNEYGKGTIYKTGESVSDLAPYGSSITLYAIWKRNGAGFIQRPLLDVNMFQGDYSIRGQKGTVYNSEYKDSRYAHIDQSNNPGYFSKK